MPKQENMELKDFISNTLTQIAEGVQEAINKSANSNYLVNPSQQRVGAAYAVHFDLSVETTKEAGANIKILNGAATEASFNRISFDVSMTYPTSGNINGPKRPD